MTPFHCPKCDSEDIYNGGQTANEWDCNDCGYSWEELEDEELEEYHPPFDEDTRSY